MSLYKVSIIIATYNTAEYLEECLESIFNQTLKDIEVILIDDGSTDNTNFIVEKYKKKYNNLVSFYQENAGAGMARNFGITQATGEYMIFMDPDDKYPCNNCLEKLYVTAKEQGALICGGNIVCNDNGVKRNQYLAGQGDVAHTKNNFINVRNYFFLYGHTRYLFNTKFINDNQIEYAVYSRYEDQVFTVKALGIAGRFYELNYPIYEYRVNYKPVRNDADMCFNIFSGIRDTYDLIVKYDLRLMFEYNYWKDIQTYVKRYIDYMFCENSKVNIVLHEINELVRRSGWESEEGHYITQCKVFEYRESIRQEKAKIDRILMSGKPVIIYGAGMNARKLILANQDKLHNIIGIAVSNLAENNSKFGGFKVNIIEHYSLYKDSAIVLITPSRNFRNDIVSILKSNGFKSYEWIDGSMI